MLANLTCFVDRARRSIAAAFVFGAAAFVASPAVLAQNAVNTASVTTPATVTDPNAANNTATDSDPITRTTNLSLVKTASPNPVVVGQTLTYTLTVTNGGPSAILASDTFSLVESLPAGLSGCVYTPSTGTFNVGTIAPGATGTGTWTSAAIASGGSITLTITCSVTASAAASITNSATIVPPTGVTDPDCSGAPVTCAGNNTSSVGTTVNRPQLTMTKTASTASFTVGVPASYTLQLSNTGTAATTAAATITDTIPTGLTIGTLPAGCSAAGQTVTCTVAAGLAAGGSTSFVIPVTPTAAAAASVTNTATVSGGGDATCPADARCTSSVTTAVNRADINAAKTAGVATGPSVAGTYTVTYTVTVTNSGTASGTYGPLSDAPVFPANINISGATWTTSGAGAPAGGSSATGGAYALAPAGTTIGAGVTHTYNLTITYTYATNTPATVCAGVPTPGSGLYNAVSLPVGQEGGAATDNAACVNTPPPPPFLTMTKTASASPWTVGVPASYTLQVTNTGGVATTAAATITDTIPTGLTIGTLPAGCTAAGQTVTCTIAAGLAVSGSTSFVIPVTPTLAAGTSVTNTATVSGGGDPGCGAQPRCTSSVGPTTINAPQLSAVKISSAPTFIAGQQYQYILRVNNTGTAATTAAVTLTDTIPAGVTIDAVDPGCTVAGQTITCTVPAGLAAGNFAGFIITVTPTASAASPVVNTLTVSGGGDPTCPAAARCSATTSNTLTVVQLTLTKTASASPWTVGVPASYTLQLSNTGTAATTAVSTITDTIPTGLTIGTLPAGCSAAGQTVTCTVAAGLAAGGSTSFVIPVTPTAAAGTSVTNTATVNGGGDPTCPANARCTSTAGPTTINAPQLTLAKTASASPWTVGVPASYTLQLSNTGTAATTAVSTITDTIPTGLTIGTLPAGCSAAGQTVTCTVAAGLAAGGSTSFVIPVTPTLAAGTSVTNTATVSGGGDPTCPGDARCSSTAGPTPINAPQLTLTKTASASPWTVGVPASYTLQLSNTGTAATTAVSTITDTIPTGLTIGTLPAGCSAAGQTVTCTVAAGLAAGGSTSFVIPVTPTLAAGTSVTNTASVTGGGDPTCPANARCTSTAGPTTINAPQLTLAKTASASPWTVGVPASYTLQLSNTGTAATTAVSTITDTIPTGLTIGTLPAGCSAAGQTVTCTVAAGLAAGGSTSFVIPVTPTAAAGTSVTNTATVNGGGDPTCPADARCSSTAGPTPIGGAQLTLLKTASAAPWTVGVPASYTLQLSNTGSAATTAVATITDTIPASLTIGTLPAGCSAAGQTVTCTVAAGLAAGGSTNFVIPVTPTAAAAPSVTNTASVSGGGDPTCPGDARCSSTAGPTPVNASADLSIVKTQSTPNPAVPGQTVTWTVTVTNSGPSDAAAVTTTDTVSASVTGLSVGGADGASCTVTGQDVNCAFGTVANGASRTFTISGTLAANFTGNLANTATVTSTTADPTPGNNSSTSSTPSAPSADAAIAKTLLTASPVQAGGTVSYQIVVTNAGPSNLVAASVADTLPAQLTGATWTCTATGSASCGTASGNGNVATTVDIAAGGGNSITIVVTGTAPVTTPSTIAANTATVSVPGGTTDPTPGNNSSTVPAIPVTALVIDAFDDDYTGTPVNGGSGGNLPSVLANDTLNGGPVTVGGGGNVTLTPGAAPTPASGSIVMNPDGTITIAPGTTAGVYTYTYTICEVLNPTNCDTATATIVVDAPVIIAVDDTGGPVNGASGGVGVPNVLVNDTLNGAPATLSTVVLSQVSTTNPNVTLNPATGAVNVAPGTPAGTYAVTYEICDLINGTNNCATATATVTVSAPPIVANPDSGTVANGANGGVAVPNVLANDTLNGGPATLANVVLTQTATTNPNVTLNPATGAVNVAPGTPAGTYTVTYQICDVLNGPLNCSTTTVTVTVGAAPIDALDDDYTGTPVNGGSGGNLPTVLANDTLNGGPVTVGVGGNVTLTPGAAPTPAVGSIVMNPDGTITIAPGTTAGVYTYAYTICEVLNGTTNCDTATATIVVDAPVIVAVDDTGGPVNGASGGVGVPNVLVNDTLNGAPATLSTVVLSQVSTTNPNVTLNPATGAVNVAPGTPAGTYAVTYEICDLINGTNNCATATATVTVSAPPIVANPDSGTVANGANGGVAVPNVLANDTLNGGPATLANVVLTQTATTNPNVTLNPATGAVNVAPGTPAGTYTVTYQICDVLNGPLNCSTTTVTVTVGAAPIDALDDDYTGTPVNGGSGGNLPTVLANDTLNGGPVTVGVGGNVTLTPGAAPTPAVGSIVMNPDGTITIAPGTTAGVYTYAYTICEVLNGTTNCDTATATIVVDAPVIIAVDDTGGPVNGASGGVGVPNVLVNDTLNGAPATLSTVVLSQVSTTNPNVTLNPATGAVNVAPGTPAGTYAVTYEICDLINGTNNCATATATVTVSAPPIVANPDSGTVANGANGGVAVPNVLANDTLNGGPATLANVVLTQTATTNPNVTLNPATGAVNVAPGTPAGTYTVTYQICDVLNGPLNCSTTTVTVTVGAAPIDALDDDYTGTPVNGGSGGNLPTVLANDTLNGGPVTVGVGGNVTLTPGAAPTPAVGSIVMNPDGTITIAPGTTAGVYTYAYTICEVLNGTTNCDTATATIVVDAPVIIAVDDTGGPVNGASGGVGVPNVLVNDTLNGAPATLSTVVLSQVSTTNPNVTLNPATGAVNVAPGTPAGTYAVTYEICDLINGTNNCATATATVTVSAPPIVANPDSGTVANGANGGVAVPNVLANDTLNGGPATLANVVLTQTATTNPNVTLNPATGAVNVAPGTPAGTYTVTYQICDVLNGPLNCSTTTVTVTVGAAPIDALDDDYTGTPVNGGSGGNLPTVLANDTLNGGPVTVGVGGNVTLTPGAAPTPAVGSIVMNPDGTITIAPGTTAGVYTYAYTICEVLNGTTNCDTATATIVVDAPVIIAVDDTGGPVNGASGGVGVPNVLVNDTLNGAPATLSTVVLSQVSTTNPNVTLNPATGAVNVAPGTPAGTYAVTYEICDLINGTNNCATATATVTVSAPPIVANPDSGTVANGANGGVAVPNVLANDTLNGGPATLANVVLTQTATTNPNVTLNPATGAVNVAPGTPAGTYTVTYQICDVLNGPLNCSTTTVTVTVGAAPIDALDDDYTGTPVNGGSGGNLPTVLANDTLNGGPVTVGVGGNVTLTPGAAPTPAVGSIVMNPDGTITIAPGTTAGVYTYAYTICEVLNGTTNCDTATATIVVDAPVIIAVDDTGGPVNGASGGVGVPNVLVNDTLNGAPATLSTVVLSQVSTTNPNVTLNPATGAVNVAPGTPAGTYAVTYEICDLINGTNNCATATATVTVSAPPIVANPDSGTVANGANGGVAVPNVLANDTLNGGPATLANVVLTQTATTNPNVTLNPATGAVNVAPGTPAGTYTVTYQICDVLNGPLNCSTTTVTVTVGAAPIDALDDDYTGTPVNGGSGGNLPTVLANDTLNGGPVTVGVGGNVTLTPGAAPTPAVGSIVMNPDGTITIAPGTTAGVYTYAYTICEVLNGTTNCDTATATIVVDAPVIVAVDDTGGPVNGASGGVGVPNVLVNDTLNGAPATLSTVVLSQVSTTNPNVTLNPATGAVNVAPGTPAGTYAVTYEICDLINGTNNCATATATVTVSAPPIVANPDSGTVANGANGGVAVPNVLANDTLNGGPATLANVVLTQTATTNPNVTLNPATGAVNVAPGTPAGTYTVTYQICDVLNGPLNCSTTTVTVTVGAAPIDALDDDYTGTPVNGGSGGNLPTVLANDTLNGGPVTVGVGGNVTLTPGAAPTPAVGSIVMNPDGTITIAPGTTAGVYTYAYTICEVLNGTTNCDTATATIVVDAPVIIAVDDTGGPVNGASGGVGVPNVLVNDTLNGAPATLSTVVLSQVSTTNPNVTLNPATGAVNVAPGTPAGTYAVTYEICDLINGTNNCATATATVTVSAPPIVANPDSGTVANGANGGVAVPNVLANDTLNGGPATLANVVLTQTATTNPNVTLNPATGAVNVAPGTPAGTYTVTYQICDVLNGPLNCSTTTVTVTVGAALIDAVDDNYPAVDGLVGATTPSVLVNDTLDGNPVTVGVGGNVTLTPGTAPTPTSGSIVMNPDGTITIAPNTEAGTYTYPYTICEVLNGTTNCDTATATIVVTAQPSLTVVKTAGTPSGNTAGSTIAYSFLVTNTGNVTITALVVNDAQLDAPGASCPVTTLAPGASTTCTGVHTITQAEVDAGVVNNSATVTGSTPGGGSTTSPPSTTSTPIASAPALTVVKTAGTPSGSTAGSTIAYSFLVTNTGNVTITGLVVNDAQLDAPGASCPVTTLAPGASTTCTGVHTITQAEVDAGVVNNSATVTGSTPGGGSTTSPPSTTSTPIASAPALTVVKTAGTPSGSTAGSTIAYSFLVTNTGNVTITGLVVNDAQLDAPGASCPVTTLAPGASTTCTGVHTITQAEVDAGVVNNSATVTGSTPGGGSTTSPPSTTSTPIASAPALTVVKTAGTPSGSTAGSTIAYSFLVTNTGNVTITGLVVNDAQLDAPGASCPVTTLAPGASTTCTGVHTITQAEVDAGVVNNSATVTGSTPGGGSTTSPPSTTSTPLVQSPSLSLVKAQPTGSLTAGSTITYTVTATNTGNTTQANVVVSDPMLTPNSATCASVVPGGTCVLTGTYVVRQADVDAGQIVNTASVTSTTITTPVTATVTTPIARNPAISATKTATLTSDGGVAGSADVGDVITYAVTVTNTGNVTMTLNSVMDSLEGRTPVALTCTPTTLAPGQSATCNSYTYTVVDSDITTVGPTLDNVVTATGTSVGSAQSVSSSSTAVVTVNGAPATVRVTKVASPRDVKVGDLVRYTVTMQNTSQTPVVDGTLIDTPPAGFTYVEGSLTVADADNNGRLVGTFPIRVDRIDIAPAGRATITYLLRVGAGVRPGIHTNSAVVEDNGGVVSNVATADVQLTGDPMLEESLIVGSVFNDTNGNGLQDEGERGVPGVRIATVEGILVETDQFGRYHLTGMNGGRWERGRNLILKVDPATLPPGTTFTTDNPLVKRVTPGLPVRFDFGVKLVEGTFEGGTKAVEMELGSVMFAPGSAEIRAEYREAIDRMAETTQKFGGGEVIVAAEGDSDLLAFERAVAVRDALVAKLPPAVASALRISVRANPQEPASTVVGVMDWPLIGTFLFETDSAEIKPEYLPLVRRIAEYMAEIGTTRVAVVGHADKRGSEEHNVALGIRRAKAVQEAIAEALPAEMRNGVKVDFNVDPAAPAGMNGL